MSQDIQATISDKLRLLPDKPGVYLMKSEQSDVIYVGKATSLRNRVRSYFQKGQTHSTKVQVLVSHIEDLEWIVTESEVEALMLECNLIKKHHPRYNVRLRDDKHYPYLCLTLSEVFPRIIVTRRIKQDKNRYFGPYADAASMRESLILIRKIFKIRSCNKKISAEDQDKPCLNFHMKQCEAPCSGRITKDEYSELVRDVSSFLEGHQETLAAHLETEMASAAESLEFERAAKYRDQAQSIRTLLNRQKVISTDMTEQDIIAAAILENSACIQLFNVRSGKLTGRDRFFMDGALDESPEEIINEFIKQYYRDSAYVPKELLLSHEPIEYETLKEWLSSKRKTKVSLIIPKRGEKHNLVKMALENAVDAIERENQLKMSSDATSADDLDDLQQVLDLESAPLRIEAFDNSNTQGTEAVSSMIVFVNGKPDKSQYRRFKIHMTTQPDDYANMREVVSRRFTEYSADNEKFAVLPDLLLIDGGIGQLGAAQDAMKERGFDIPMISLAKRFEEIYTTTSTQPLLLPRDSRALRLLQRIRDEAHRFAVTYHKTLRDKSVRRSTLDSIPGVGDMRRKALIKKFGSVAGIKKASLEEIESVSGINKNVAQVIYDYFNST
ncbi:MAG: excinuclease ABC subunit UvrC [Armatimonadota bacterium]